MKSFYLVSIIFSAVSAFTPSKAWRTARTTTLEAISVPEIPVEGERTIVDGPDGPILVAKVAGSFYAVDATCPHLGLPMKKGKIDPTGAGGDPELTCNFHNSCFNMKTGACTKWVTGALGVKSGFVAGIMSKVGSEQKDVKAYEVVENEDGTLELN
jgi:nitrite reductase/ring-hydroxylating ferredoxin subunit